MTAADERYDVGAVGAEQRRFGGILCGQLGAAFILRQAKIGPPRLNGYIHAAAAGLDKDVVVAKDIRALGGANPSDDP